MQPLLIVDAVVAIAQSEARDAWARYSALAPTTVPEVPAANAARELLRQARLSGNDLTLRWVAGGPEVYECVGLEDLFLEKFIAAVRAGRYRLRGVPHGAIGGEPIDINPSLITLETLRRLKGDRWELAGTLYYAVDVQVVEPAPAAPLPGQPAVEAEPTRWARGPVIEAAKRLFPPHGRRPKGYSIAWLKKHHFDNAPEFQGKPVSEDTIGRAFKDIDVALVIEVAKRFFPPDGRRPNGTIAALTKRIDKEPEFQGGRPVSKDTVDRAFKDIDAALEK
jgi:hypothetical protein